jgi:hypothetical protein
MSRAARRRRALRWCRYRSHYPATIRTGTTGAAKAILVGYRDGWWPIVRKQGLPT